ncbi:alanine racemase [Populibacterium corticicola]|uniref:Alanine racemase n=1 Tax=Populibacterium corticicola TaxID=1812826 RepID=A0ABW5XKQ7_9MICO
MASHLSQTLSAATTHLPAPISVVDLAAFDANARHMATRTHGKPIRVATKSLRNRTLIDRALETPGYQGLMCYSLREALWLVGHGYTDILVAYPTVDRAALASMAQDERALAEIVLIVDCVEHAELISAARPVSPVQVAFDVDASLRIGRNLGIPLHLGVRRSPVHTVQDAVSLLGAVASYEHVRVVGAMFYDAQIAGMPDNSWPVRTMKKISRVELAERRAEIVAALELRVDDLRVVNAGGTGSVGDYERATEVTEVTAGSGFYAPALFDGYRGLGLRPAAYFGLDVVRHPGAGFFTAFAGGYVASGPPHVTRRPVSVDSGFRFIGAEGVGEVQTALRMMRGTVRPEIGERVWFRHAKAGEQMERFNVTYLLDGSHIVDESVTYRGEGQNFG